MTFAAICPIHFNTIQQFYSRTPHPSRVPSCTVGRVIFFVIIKLKFSVQCNVLVLLPFG